MKFRNPRPRCVIISVILMLAVTLGTTPGDAAAPSARGGAYACSNPESLAVGKRCRQGDVVFVGDALGYRLYTVVADQGHTTWDEARRMCMAMGYGWRLPTKDELNQLFLARQTGALKATFDETGGYPTGLYWSGSPHEGWADSESWGQRFNNGEQLAYRHVFASSVRCVSRFDAKAELKGLIPKVKKKTE